MVALGRVRAEDKVGNDFADRAADLERRKVSDLVMDVRRRFVSACSLWYPVVLELHRFFVAIARAAVNEDGCAGVALHPTLWSSGGLVKRRKTRVSAWEFARVPGLVGLSRHGSVGWPRIEVRDVDVGFWPYSVGLLEKLCSFLSSLHWSSSVSDLGVGGVSFVELLVLYERWAGERLVLEMTVPKPRRFARQISVSAVPAGPSIDIWRSCRFLGAMIGALGGLPGGLGRFLPCRLGANHCRLRSVGWERCGHGLTSRPLEASGFLDDSLSLFGYPAGSGRSLVDGSRGMRYCSTNFASKKPTWKLPPFGGVAAFIGCCGCGSHAGSWFAGFSELSFFRCSGEGGRKRIRLTKKTNVRKRFGVEPWRQPIPK